MADTDSRVFLRRRDAANDLAVSESQLLKWERLGVITPIEIPGIRAKRYTVESVRNLARNIAAGRLSTEPSA
jgi:hypothetical protein